MLEPSQDNQQPSPTDPHQLLTAKQVAALLCIGPKKVYSLPISQIRFSDHRVRFSRLDVDAFIRRHRRGA